VHVLQVAVPYYCSVFFFYGSPPHLDLHSFPTRRSSDLVHVEIATACAVEPLLDRLDGGVIVGGVDGLEGPPRARRVPEAAGGSRSGKRIGALRRCLTPRRYDAKKSPRTEHQELTPVDVQRSVVASGDAHFPSSTKRTEYPACARFAAGEPPGHMTISPPSATIIP